jgi:hypothetical protein
VELNEARNVEIIHAAVAEEKGSVSYETQPGAAEYKVSHQKRADSSPELVEVRAITIDNRLGPQDEIDLIKVDVEGAELRVLRGAIHTMKASHPNIIVEVHPSRLSSQGGSVDELMEILIENGYEVYKVMSPDDSQRGDTPREIGENFNPRKITTIYATTQE